MSCAERVWRLCSIEGCSRGLNPPVSSSDLAM
jgi:hypothetical protein